MVDIKHLSLRLFPGLVLYAAGCAMNPFQSSAPAPVTEPGRSQEHAPQPGKAAGQPPTTETAAAAVPQPVPETSSSGDSSAVAPAEKQDSGRTGPAVVALLDESDRNSTAGRHEQAVASLERAIRIEPKNPLPWHKLSRLRLDEKNWKQALALAEKSNVLAAGNKALQAENWKIIAQAAAALGDAKGASQAREMVRQLEKK